MTDIFAFDEINYAPKGGEDASGATEATSAATMAPRRVVQIITGNLHEAVDETERALLDSGCEIYQRNGLLVRPAMMPVKVSDGRAIEAQVLVQVKNHNLAEEMTRCAEFQRYNSQKAMWVTVDIDRRIPEMYLQREGQWHLRVVTGLINAPTIKPDGSILSVPGYDPDTGLIFDPLGVTFPPIPLTPTRDDALAALKTLSSLVETFPFVGPADRSIALSAILTAVARAAILTAPMHGFTATTAGSGKSKLTDMASLIATGREAAVMAQGKNEEETEKRLGAALLAGDPIISIDNCEQPLGGVLLCQMLSQPLAKVRVLGQSKNVDVPNSATVFATGNNLVLLGDMARRALLCRLDAGVECPELRQFDHDPITLVKAHRAEFVVAGLTLLRAFHVAGRPRQTVPLGSFEDWSMLIRDALIWLGEADPCLTMNEVRNADPKLGDLRRVMEQWSLVFGTRPTTAADAIASANDREQVGIGKYEYKNPALREALYDVAGLNGEIKSRKLGSWIGGVIGRIVDGKKFTRGTMLHGNQTWRLDDAAALEFAA